MASLQELKQAKNAAIADYSSDPTEEKLKIRDAAIAAYDAAVKEAEKGEGEKSVQEPPKEEKQEEKKQEKKEEKPAEPPKTQPGMGTIFITGAQPNSTVVEDDPNKPKGDPGMQDILKKRKK